MGRHARTATTIGITPKWAAILAGVYIIEATDGSQYVGGTRHFANRWKSHRSELRNGRHHSALLQSAWDKFGEPVIGMRVIIVCRESDVLSYEQQALDVLCPNGNTAIFAEFSKARQGVGHGDAARAKMSAAQKGRPKPKSPEHRAAIAEAMTGRVVPADVRSKMSATRTGKKRGPFSEAHRAAISAAATGRKVSDETKAKIAAVHTGAKRSDSTREAISNALRGKTYSPERRKAISEGRLRAKRLRENGEDR